MHVFRSLVIEAPIDAVWTAIRRFDGGVDWNPAVTGAHMESGAPTETGHIRHLDIADGTVFRETLLAHSDLERSYTYDIVEGPLPIKNYVSTHRLIAITEGDKTLSIWESSFDCAPDMVEQMDNVVGDLIYVGGMQGLNSFVKG